MALLSGTGPQSDKEDGTFYVANIDYAQTDTIQPIVQTRTQNKIISFYLTRLIVFDCVINNSSH